MLMHLKKCGSPSSASLEDSDEKPSPGSSNLQLRTSGPGFGRGPGDDQRPSHSGIQPGSSHEPMTNTDEAQAYLSAMSLSTPPNPLILHGSKHQLTMMAGTADDSDDNNVYQQYLPGPTVESRSLRVASSNVDDFLILRQSWKPPALLGARNTCRPDRTNAPFSHLSLRSWCWTSNLIKIRDSWCPSSQDDNDFRSVIPLSKAYASVVWSKCSHLGPSSISWSEYKPGTSLAWAKSPSSRWIRQVSHISSELDSPTCTVAPICFILPKMIHNLHSWRPCPLFQ